MNVSVIIPVYNEEKYIEETIMSIENQTYDKSKIEVIVVDGMSSDKTVDILNNLKDQLNISMKIEINKKRIAPTAMNIGIKVATGDVIIRIDGHSYMDKNFIKEAISFISDRKVDCVGGPIYTINNSFIGEAISKAMSCPFGVGNAKFRYSSEETYVDTLAFGAYKKDVFEEVGLFDEELVRNQDDEFNLRLVRSGGKILLTPNIKSYYYSRSSIKKLWKQYFQYGYWKVRVIQKHKIPSSIRQLVPATFVTTIVTLSVLSIFSKIALVMLSGILFLYITFSIVFSIMACKFKEKKFIGILPMIFLILHISYGIGFLKGILDFGIFNKANSKYAISNR
ncbi:glycosyltransferase family 2 protein [Paraclostridium sordellii]|uniref:glycosyltransferase family 2 protein n=1 Tax=Paraclostridium sordellii TaxID=1505 RepID=UPI0022E72E58|nr:glycosyltransferase family 2 protein [Paeniclostridium sordellii]